MKKTDTQKENWIVTLNNPEEYGVTHEIIKETLLSFATIQYFAIVDEKGSCYPIHCLICFRSRVRFSTLKRKPCFSKAHIEDLKGTPQQCVTYLQKSGKWLFNKEKQEQVIEGTFESWGELPPEITHKRDMSALLHLVEAGYTDLEIINKNPDYISIMEKIERLRTKILIEKYKGTRRLNLHTVYISGPTATGKSRYVLDTHGDINVYRVTDYKHPFDHYSNEPVLCFDEFRSQIRLSEMLVYTDIYPIQLPARYANTYACYETVYIVSNWSLESQFTDAQETSPESWNAFLRRIHEVRIFNVDGTVTIYDSVEKYLKRNEEFHTIDSDIKPPFEETKENEVHTNEQ